MVTGGAGYVGGTVATLLASQGHQPTVFDNLCHARREMVPAGVEFVEGDLADRALIEKIFRVCQRAKTDPSTAVLHFAALIEAGESMVQPEIYFRNNTASTLAMLEATLAMDRDALSSLPPRPFTASLNPSPSRKTRDSSPPTSTGNQS